MLTKAHHWGHLIPQKVHHQILLLLWVVQSMNWLLMLLVVHVPLMPLLELVKLDVLRKLLTMFGA